LKTRRISSVEVAGRLQKRGGRSRFAANSILNRFGPFGSKFAPFSPCNVSSTTPPVIVDDDGEDYGELTLNRDSPRQAKIEGLNAWLAALCAAK